MMKSIAKSRIESSQVNLLRICDLNLDAKSLFMSLRATRTTSNKRASENASLILPRR